MGAIILISITLVHIARNLHRNIPCGYLAMA